jgi:hypothetical protein
MTVGAGAQQTSRYVSSVLDTKSVATWGVVQWNATGDVVLSTRSGNTARPDDSWSPWSDPYTQKQGQPVTSPAARFVQWRAVLTRAPKAPSPALSSVTLAYLPRNNRPVVAGVTTYPPGVVFQRPFVNDDSAIAGLDQLSIEARRPAGEEPPAAPALNRRMFQKGLQTITWKAEDEDGDQLVYTVQHRRDSETTWRDLVTNVPSTIFVWDTTTVTDGRYLVRVQASDGPSNAGTRALVGSREGGPIEVDNAPPAVTVTVSGTGAERRAAVVVRDAQSSIQQVEYAIRGGEWRQVYPVDGLADSQEERYDITLPADAAPADVMIRATDKLLNVATAPAGR